MFKRTKIPCYVLIYDQFDIIDACLRFLVKSADKLDIIVIENPSDNTPKISRTINELGKQGLIKSHYLFEKNITNNALIRILEEQAETIRKSPYILLTDGDITSTDRHWLSEELRILKKHPEISACGISLDRSNLPLSTFPNARDWLPPDVSEQPDYFEAVTGVHLLLTSGKLFYDYMQWVTANNLKSVDSAMHRYCTEVLGMKWARTKKAVGYHLTWDLYQDLEHPYTKLKLNKSYAQTWQHDEQSDYTLTKF